MSNIDNNKNSTTTTTTTSTSTRMTGRQRRKKLKCFHLPVLLSAGGGRAGGAPPQHLRPGAAPSPSLLICYLIITLLASITAGPTTVLGHQPPRPPTITEHPTSVIVRKQEPTKLECKADGHPKPTIEWYKDGKKVEGRSNRFFSDDASQLIFLFVNAKKGENGDVGTYHCLAKNEVGKVHSHNATLGVAFLREEFRTMPRNAKVALGETAIFECTPPKGYPEPEVWWTHNDQRVETSAGGRYRLANHNLVITDVGQDDQGKYQCIAKNMMGENNSPPAILKVLVKPYFIRPPEDVQAMANEDIIFHCKVGGDPAPSITWTKAGGKLPTGRSQIFDDKALRISEVRQSDQGTYICEVENSVGKLSHSATLTVHSMPTVVATPKDTRVAENKAVKFECSASGSPQPLYFWSKEGTQVMMFPGRSYGKYSVSAEGTLTIAEVKKDDQSYYTCSAVSLIGSTLARVYLSVVSDNEFPPPIIMIGAANQTLPTGTRAWLPCETNGFHHRSITKWYFNGSPIFNDTHCTINDAGLVIQDIHPKDSGVYTCEASSPSGVTRWPARLNVESPRNPNIKFHKMPDPSMFPEPPGKPYAVNVTDNSITVRWERPGSSGASAYVGSILECYSPDLRPGGWWEVAKRITFDQYTLTDLRPNTRYLFVVRAENHHGIGYPSSVSDEIKTIDTLAAETVGGETGGEQTRRALNDIFIRLKDVRILSSHSVKLLWNVVKNVEYIEGYYIYYQLAPNNDLTGTHPVQMVTVFDVGATNYVLEDLRKYSTYRFFIIPFVKGIEGKPSNALVAKTSEDVPAEAPQITHIKPLNATSARLEWTAPPEESRNGNIVGYNIQIYENDTFLYSNLSLDATQHVYSLDHLNPHSYYTVRLLAYTSVGASPPSKPYYLAMNQHDKHGGDGNSDGQFGAKGDSIFGDIFHNVWFYIFLFIVLLIFVFLITKITCLYVSRKTSPKSPIYEKSTSLNEGYNDHFPKYDSNSSKYSSFQDNNEYAEVNDLKTYGTGGGNGGDGARSDKSSLVAYAMTPLIDGSGSSGASAVRHVARPQLATDVDPEVTESLLQEQLNSFMNAAFLQRVSNENGQHLLANGNGPPVGHLYVNNYEKAINQPGQRAYFGDNKRLEPTNSSERPSTVSIKHFNSVQPFHNEPERVNRSFRDHKLSTFVSSNNANLSPRMAPSLGSKHHHQQQPPMFHHNETSSSHSSDNSTTSRGADSYQSNHYSVSEDVTRMSHDPMIRSDVYPLPFHHHTNHIGNNDLSQFNYTPNNHRGSESFGPKSKTNANKARRSGRTFGEAKTMGQHFGGL